MFNEKFNNWLQPDYIPLSGDDMPSPERQTHPLNSLAQRQVVVWKVLCLIAVQLALWACSIILLLNQRKGIALPLDSHLHDELGNSYPAAAVVKHEIKTFRTERKYMSLHGVPSSATDQAWLDLMGSTEGLVQLSTQAGFEIDRLPTTIESKNQKGLFLYGLEVHHQLHCLDRIRKSFYPKHYFSNETEKDVIHHREHCLDHIRQSIMCAGDFALDRWYYDSNGKDWLATDVPHVCRNFDALQDWQEANRLTQVFIG